MTESDNPLSLDHFGAICRDLKAGAARWERLGFVLTPQTQQMGLVPGGTVPEPWATANRCVMLEHGYLELMGVTEPQRYNPLSHLAARYEGIHLLVLRCRDADAFYRVLAQRAVGMQPPVQRMRRIRVDGKSSELRFRVIFSSDEHYPEGRFVVIEHQTPESLWQRRFMQHPNGALALTGVAVVAVDPESSAARIAALTGVAARRPGDGVFEFEPGGGGKITVLHVNAVAARFPGQLPPVLPAFFGATVAFADLAHARRLIEQNGVKVHESPQGPPWVAPPDTNGLVLCLEQA